MTDSDAAALVARLTAAFPTPTIPEATRTLYGEELGKLADVEAAGEAVEGLVLSASAWPPLATILAAYRRAARRRREAEARRREADEPEVVRGPDHARAILAALPEKGGPLCEIVRATMGRVAGLPPLTGEGEPVVREEAEANPGPCGDCRRKVAARFAYGSLEICAKCLDARVRVAASLETEEPGPPPGGEA